MRLGSHLSPWDPSGHMTPAARDVNGVFTRWVVPEARQDLVWVKNIGKHAVMLFGFWLEPGDYRRVSPKQAKHALADHPGVLAIADKPRND